VTPGPVSQWHSRVRVARISGAAAGKLRCPLLDGLVRLARTANDCGSVAGVEFFGLKLLPCLVACILHGGGSALAAFGQFS